MLLVRMVIGKEPLDAAFSQAKERVYSRKIRVNFLCLHFPLLSSHYLPFAFLVCYLYLLQNSVSFPQSLLINILLFHKLLFYFTVMPCPLTR